MDKHVPRDPEDITGGEQIATTPQDARENVEADRLASSDSPMPGEEQPPPAGSPAAAGQSASRPAESGEPAEDEDEDEKKVMGQPSVMPGTHGAVAGTAFSHLVEDDETANRNPAVAAQLDNKREEDRKDGK
ncbi:hypothetical protein [Lolliginicoccus suaedae]|uniref:hypothetical protein n=1 Tax=Lolliginicoccus suaedae TaxID=2605429 RepID=UPI0011EFF85C|nr:hypothetical protein [Lolliginicoccus suaedae]